MTPTLHSQQKFESSSCNKFKIAFALRKRKPKFFMQEGKFRKSTNCIIEKIFQKKITLLVETKSAEFSITGKILMTSNKLAPT